MYFKNKIGELNENYRWIIEINDEIKCWERKIVEYSEFEEWGSLAM